MSGGVVSNEFFENFESYLWGGAQNDLFAPPFAPATAGISSRSVHKAPTQFMLTNYTGSRRVGQRFLQVRMGS